MMTAIYFAVRLFGKLLGIFTATRIFRPAYPIPAGLGLGLISEGGLAVAIVINFRLLCPLAADCLITVIILSAFVNELVSPALILTQFDDAERLPDGRVRAQEEKRVKTVDI